jgi:hypothetical protein
MVAVLVDEFESLIAVVEARSLCGERWAKGPWLENARTSVMQRSVTGRNQRLF